jgi:hypothetical protein
MLTMRGRTLWIAGVAVPTGLVAALLVLREPMEPLTTARLEEAERQWSAAGIRDYEARYLMHDSEYRVVVRDGIVGELTLGGAPATTAQRGAYSMDGLFELLHLELEMFAPQERDPGTDPGVAPGAGGRGSAGPALPAVLLRVRFHPDLGYIERYLRAGATAGRDVTIELHSFRRLD